MLRAGCGLLAILVALCIVGRLPRLVRLGLVRSSSEVEKDTAFIVSKGATLTAVADQLEKDGHHPVRRPLSCCAPRCSAAAIRSRRASSCCPPASRPRAILDTLQHGEVIRRFVTIPEGLPSVMVATG